MKKPVNMKKPMIAIRSGANLTLGTQPFLRHARERLSGNLKYPSFRGSGAAREPGTQEHRPLPAWEWPVLIGPGPGSYGPSRNDEEVSARQRHFPDSLFRGGGGEEKMGLICLVRTSSKQG
jgi:hypothetical protein